MSKVQRAGVSILIAGAVSVLPLFLALTGFLSVPGAMLTLLLFGPRVQMTEPLVRAPMNFIVWSAGLYFAVDLWRWGQSNPSRKAPGAARWIFIFWVALLLPWLVVAPLSVMAFDAGYNPTSYAFVWSVWTYPIAVGIAAVFRRWVPWVVLLPVLNFAACGVPALLPK
jgi:hypothetical protein